MANRDIVIVGGGQAAAQAAASLRADGHDGTLTVIGAEGHLPYQRPPLSKAYLAGKQTVEQLYLRPASYYAGHDVRLLTGETVTAVDRAARRVSLASGDTLAYDHLILATGSHNRLLPLPGADAANVLGLRTIADADRLKQRFGTAGRAVVIGAGFIGLEFAAVARMHGLEVTVLEAQERCMARSVGPAVSAFFRDLHEGHGVKLVTGIAVAAIETRAGEAEAVRLADGTAIGCDLVVYGIGAVAAEELATAAGLPCDRGILVDARMRTPDPAVSAIGDCTNHPNIHAGGRMRLESVQNAIDQAKTCSAELCARGSDYAAVPWFWSDQYDIKLQTAGIATGHDQAVLRGSAADRRFSMFYFRGGRLIAVDSVNQPADHMVARRLLAGEPRLTPEAAGDPSFDLRALAKAA